MSRAKSAQVPAAVSVEDQHATEQLEHDHQAGIGVLRLDPTPPLAADREHLAVEAADGLVLLISKRCSRRRDR